MDYFEIKPFEGFGAIEFGMTREQVSQYSLIYGEITSEDDIEAGFREIAQGVIIQFGDYETKNSMQELQEAGKGLFEEFRDKNISITSYYYGKLNYIDIDIPKTELHFNGRAFQSTEIMKYFIDESNEDLYIDYYTIVIPGLDLNFYTNEGFFDEDKNEITIDPSAHILLGISPKGATKFENPDAFLLDRNVHVPWLRE